LRSARRRPAVQTKTRYDALVSDAIISAAELDLAQKARRAARARPRRSPEHGFPGPLAAIGAALSKFFGVLMSPSGRNACGRSICCKNLKRDYVEANQWLPVEETQEGVVVVAIDPERLKLAHGQQRFPEERIVYRVTHAREFAQLVDQFFGAAVDMDSVGDMLSGLDDADGRRCCRQQRRGAQCRSRQRTRAAGEQDHRRGLPERARRISTSSRARARKRPSSASAATVRWRPTSKSPRRTAAR
jgi:hypothetical protein